MLSFSILYPFQRGECGMNAEEGIFLIKMIA
jgi:hypothetical protein